MTSSNLKVTLFSAAQFLTMTQFNSVGFNSGWYGSRHRILWLSSVKRHNFVWCGGVLIVITLYVPGTHTYSAYGIPFLFSHHISWNLVLGMDSLRRYNRGHCLWLQYWKLIRHQFLFQPLIVIFKIHVAVMLMKLKRSMSFLATSTYHIYYLAASNMSTHTMTPIITATW
jgi:hypothetical protein